MKTRIFMVVFLVATVVGATAMAQDKKDRETYRQLELFGTVLENVGFDPQTRVVDYSDVSKTENTRCGYDIRIIPNHAPELRGPVVVVGEEKLLD